MSINFHHVIFLPINCRYCSVYWQFQ